MEVDKAQVVEISADLTSASTLVTPRAMPMRATTKT